MNRTPLVLLTIVSLSAASPAPAPVSNVFEIDISPEEAQRYLANPPFSAPQLSGRTAVLPLIRWNDPRFRSAEAGPTLGHYWKNGREIENTDDYVEEVYDASQFHGQDGLGAYSYGYSAPESAKVENRARSGDVTGSYAFRDGNNELIKVRYWADADGFHQEDNVPRDLPQPPQDTAEVRAARLEHQRLWAEAAAAAAQHPDPQSQNYNNQQYDSHSSKVEYRASASEQQESRAPAPAPAPAPANDPNRAARQYNAGSYQPQNQAKLEEPEPTGPPRGFFYSFTYPVSIIAAKNAEGARPQQPGTALDHDTVGVSAVHG